ncbi:cytochrome P450 monooxygenase [Colletotrichum phormii]|uniref:Cytochrome P450 monooxygenase n=1 Tax=Colletotrichum phormii TaxID=359342 RepID=A0AAJ0EEZ5_9PEZI|nr:cytochrome P450 monooxygenase [Colletotrichum phormii]KAK1634586.1 cytochrome P450 monooxygenase [Colletotrichum phormii]
MAKVPSAIGKKESVASLAFGTLAISVGLLLCYALYRGIYNLFFHPLRHWPGPFWAAASDFFKLWILHTKQAHTLGLAYHAEYGPVVRAAPNLLAVNDPRLLPAIYHRRANKTDVYTPGVLGDLAPPFQELDWREHARKRKRVASSFLLSNLVKLEGQVDARVQEWTAALATRFAHSGASMDFASWSQWFAYDTICQLSFGEPLGFVREARDVSNLIKNFHDMAPFAAVVGALPWLCAPFLHSPITKWLFMPRPGDSSGTGKIMAFRDALLNERLRDPKAHHKGDFLDNILAAKNEDGTPISVEEVKTECFVLMVAASDTTAAFFCGFVRYVLQTPGVYDKLMAEIGDFERRGKLASPVPTFEEIKAMPYLEACHRETQRYQPSTPMIIPRYVGEEGLQLYGRRVPPGTEIGANPYVVHRDKTVFGEDADVFRPERWLESPERAQEMDKYLLTWGYGPRICLGKNIALMETHKLLIQFFRLFRPSIVNKDEKSIWRQENLALLVHWDFWLNIKHRTPGGSGA